MWSGRVRAQENQHGADPYPEQSLAFPQVLTADRVERKDEESKAHREGQNESSHGFSVFGLPTISETIMRSM